MNIDSIKRLDEVDLKGKKVLLRVAYDITLAQENEKWVVPDDMRIRATLPTIQYLLDQGCCLGLLSWLKRPGGKVVEAYRMKPVAERLSRLLKRPVKVLNDCVGEQVKQEIKNLKSGEILMLENVRFHPEEEKGDLNFAKELTRGFDFIVYEAFAQAHRIHASTTGILQFLPSAAGFLFVKELSTLSRLLTSPARPFVVVMGGEKISDRVEVMQNLIGRADALLIGGALANTFFASQGLPVGKSFLEDVYVNAAKGEKKDYQAIARKLIIKNKNLRLPVDLVAAENPESQNLQIVNLDQGEVIPQGWAFYDIGPRTVRLYSQILRTAKMIFANGPMGMFEYPAFEAGTKKIAQAMIESGALTVIGGGDTESIASRWDFWHSFSHVSTGGGAALEFLAGKEFPVMKYLYA